MRVKIINEVSEGRLSFQYARWHWENKKPTKGYRFIWRDEKTGKLKPSRGQAYIPNVTIMFKLITKAIKAGWLR